jgi:ABC-type metal ion transport system substrate-binding protein
MRRTTLILCCVFVAFTFAGCGPSPAEKRAQQVAEAKDDALKLRQQLAQAKTGNEAENLRQQIIKRLNDAGLTVESIHFTDAELNNYVSAANAASAPPPAVKPVKAARQSKSRRAGKKKGR